MKHYIYGVVFNGAHIDVSTSQRGAKVMATRAGLNTITRRNANSYIATEIATKRNGIWMPINLGQFRYQQHPTPTTIQHPTHENYI